MANRYAVATGNWSNTATWDGGTLPGPGDIVRPNNFTVTIDQDIDVGVLTNDALAPAVANGHFRLTNATTPAPGITLDCDITYSWGGTLSYLLYIVDSISKPITITGNVSYLGGTSNTYTVYQPTNTHTFPSLTINGNVTMNPINTTSSFNTMYLAGIITDITINGNVELLYGNAYTINRPRSSNGDTTVQTLTINGNVVVSGASGGYAIFASTTNTSTIQAITVVGDVINSSNLSGTCIYSTHDSVLSAWTITGDVISDGVGSGNCLISTVYSAYYNRPLTINGNIICTNVYPAGAISASYAVSHYSNGNCYVSGDVTAADGKVALYVPRGRTMVAGNLTAGPNGFMPVMAANFRTPNAGRVIWTLPEDDSAWPGSPDTTPLVLSNYFTETPPEADVRAGTTYGVGGTLTGTLAVPAAGSVALGVPVDATEGEAVLLIDSGIATIDSTGAQIAAALTS